MKGHEYTGAWVDEYDTDHWRQHDRMDALTYGAAALTGQAAFSTRARAQAEHELHTPVAHDVIAAELTACVLGARRRPELRTDMTGVVTRALHTVRRFIRDVASYRYPTT